MKLSLRDKFPEMTVNTTKGEIHLPEDYHGKMCIRDRCTACHPDLLWSHRKSGSDRGSLAAFLMLK